MRGIEKDRTTSIRLSVLGCSYVGKSALTVRYLTKRFIGEYLSNSDVLYRCCINIGGSPQPVQILDTTSSVEKEAILWADAFVVVYSITDETSFEFAIEKLKILSTQRPTSPIALVGAKADLSHIREVDSSRAQAIALRHHARFYELSSAEDSDRVMSALDSYLKEVKSLRSCRSQGQPSNFSPKLRKISVSKMLGSLISRCSPPPAPITELIVLEKGLKELRESLEQICL